MHRNANKTNSCTTRKQIITRTIMLCKCNCNPNKYGFVVNLATSNAQQCPRNFSRYEKSRLTSTDHWSPNPLIDSHWFSHDASFSYLDRSPRFANKTWMIITHQSPSDFQVLNIMTKIIHAIAMPCTFTLGMRLMRYQPYTKPMVSPFFPGTTICIC